MPTIHRLLPTFLLLASCPASPVSDDPAEHGTTADETGSDPPFTPPPTTDPPTTGADTTSDTTAAQDDTTDTAAQDDTTATTSQDDDTTGTTEAPPRCGDGELDPGESCDAGDGENSNVGACLLSCEHNVCGDGFVQLGVEACDEGSDNSDFLYDGCGTNCEKTLFCGDGEVNGPEECDRGEANGTDNKDADAVPCSASCTLEALLVFISSRTYTVAELGGGAYEADARCEELAAAAMLPNHMKFRAWLSDKFSSPVDRFSAPVPGLAYALKSGLRIADDRAQLLATGPLDGITISETGATLYKAFVWTATDPDGTVFDEPLHCDNWKSSSFLAKARVGRSGVDKQDVDAWNQWQSQQQWTSAASLACDKFYHLYCFEQ